MFWGGHSEGLLQPHCPRGHSARFFQWSESGFPTTRKIPHLRVSSWWSESGTRKIPHIGVIPTTRKIPHIRVSSQWSESGISAHQEDTPYSGIFLVVGIGNFRPVGRYPLFGYLPTTRKVPGYGVTSYHQEDTPYLGISDHQEDTPYMGTFLVVGNPNSDHQEDTRIWGIFLVVGRYPISGYLPSGRKFPIPTTRKIPYFRVSSYHQEVTRIRGIFLPLGRYPIFGYLPSGWNREFPTTRKIPGYGVSSQWSEYPIIGYLPSGRKIPCIQVTSQWQEDTHFHVMIIMCPCSGQFLAGNQLYDQYTRRHGDGEVNKNVFDS